MDKVRIIRGEGIPYEFMGELIAESENTSANSCNYWFDIKIYETEGKNYVYSVWLHSRWEGQEPRHVSDTCCDIKTLAIELSVEGNAYDALTMPLFQSKRFESRASDGMDSCNSVEEQYKAQYREICEQLSDRDISFDVDSFIAQEKQEQEVE